MYSSSQKRNWNTPAKHSVVWNYLSIPKLERFYRWSLGMDTTLYYGCTYFSMLGILRSQHQMGSVYNPLSHYSDVIMGTIASQITSLVIVYSTVYSGADQRQHQSSASLAFVLGIHRWPVNSPHKWPATRKMFPFDDVIMWWDNGYTAWSREWLGVWGHQAFAWTIVDLSSVTHTLKNVPQYILCGIALDIDDKNMPNVFFTRTD